MTRDQIIAGLHTRAVKAGKKLWAYDSITGHGGWFDQTNKKYPWRQSNGYAVNRTTNSHLITTMDDLDRFAVEGDKEWTTVPLEKKRDRSKAATRPGYRGDRRLRGDVDRGLSMPD